MKLMFVAASLLAFSASPVLAQEDPAQQEPPAEKPQMCKMMHDGKEMQGMMKMGEDGKMACQMMDPSNMNHSTMQQGQSGHGETNAAEPKKAEGGHNHD